VRGLLAPRAIRASSSAAIWAPIVSTGCRTVVDGYVTPLMNWMDTEGIRYLAWAWNADFNCSSGPGLVSDYTGTPTNYGVSRRSRPAGSASHAQGHRPMCALTAARTTVRAHIRGCPRARRLRFPGRRDFS
jgi:hypothetical protein